MNLKKLLAVAIFAASAAGASADTMENLTSNKDTQILVKNRFGECVTVKANRNLTGCGEQPVVEQAPAQQVEQVLETEVKTFSADTYFDFDKSSLKPEGKAAIQQLAQELNQRGANVRKITVIGNTDSKGSDAYNQKLSERRARAVSNYLIENGVPASIIEAYGNGERQPVASNDTEAGRAQNRRVDIAVDGIVERPVQRVIN
ncbi:OmpA family protein [Dichelobacter nodosus]|uniref:OmpA family protein n=1 Tax=Dichelobacter nodosus (strain VCS1703A) TaxID=246195 RepID=A5EW67_DICNV|nr:OmpA family protein [Dichelobacter nodosus]ABQ13451.1 OmpA family protein [Dichelobacter nodosus VCS1703A]AXM45223.1 OmpA family protein [Dichelobacter nodosus]KNZ39541.1 cell envelope biogenesis protein OmpA [Dichelobacter nodosus]TGA64382.1 OmpA family protein [Dichelobacter nodosus]